MARVPPVPDQNVSPAPLPLPYAHPSATPEQYGAGIGGVVEQGAQVASRIAQDELHKADTAAVLGASTKAQQALNEIVLDPEKGYLSLKGKDAIEGRNPAVQKFNQAIKDAGDALNSDSQRLRFAQQAKAIQEQGYLRVLHHEGVESDRFMQAQFRGKVDQTMVTMESPAVVSDPSALGQQVDSLFQAGIDEARRRYGQNAGKDAIASVVVPELQKAALGVMEAAIATQDPAIAKQAFEKLGPYLVTNHQRFYAGAVQKMSTTKEVGLQAGSAVGAGLTEVPLPGGGTIMRPDANKISEALARVSADSPHRDEIVAAADKRQKAYEQSWTQSVAQIYANSLTAGIDPATGKFDISKVSPSYTEWLRVNAPDKLLALGKEDARAQRQASGEDRRVSSEYRSLVSADLNDKARWADTYSKMTPAQFLTYLGDDKQFPGGWTPSDRIAIQKEFQSLQKAGDKLEEPVGRTVKDQIADAFANADPDTRKQFEAKYFGAILDKANAFVASEKAGGRKVDTDAVRKFIDTQMAKVPSGHWYQPDKRAIELNPASALTATPPPTAASTPVAAPGRITVRNPAGKAFTIPREQVDAFLASPEGKGFSR